MNVGQTGGELLLSENIKGQEGENLKGDEQFQPYRILIQIQLILFFQAPDMINDIVPVHFQFLGDCGIIPVAAQVFIQNTEPLPGFFCVLFQKIQKTGFTVKEDFVLYRILEKKIFDPVIFIKKYIPYRMDFARVGRRDTVFCGNRRDYFCCIFHLSVCIGKISDGIKRLADINPDVVSGKITKNRRQLISQIIPVSCSSQPGKEIQNHNGISVGKNPAVYHIIAQILDKIFF